MMWESGRIETKRLLPAGMVARQRSVEARSIAWVTVLSLGTVLATGLLGRYLYALTPKSGEEELESGIGAVEAVVPGLGNVLRQQLSTVPVAAARGNGSLLGCLLTVPAWRKSLASRVAVVNQAEDHYRALGAHEHSVVRYPLEACRRAVRAQVRAVSAGALLRSDHDLIAELQRRQCTVFLVPDAAGSPFIPAQDDFVVRYGVRSVLAFGGMLPAGELFATVLFSREALSPKVAELFTPLSLSVGL